VAIQLTAIRKVKTTALLLDEKINVSQLNRSQLQATATRLRHMAALGRVHQDRNWLAAAAVYQEDAVFDRYSDL
jgi:hypothetical protein